LAPTSTRSSRRPEYVGRLNPSLCGAEHCERGSAAGFTDGIKKETMRGNTAGSYPRWSGGLRHSGSGARLGAQDDGASGARTPPEGGRVA
jgi:hypothetical protein